MEIISFDISGKFAHFRKFYATNTALTFSIPPRTTIMGMLAGITGKQKGTYHKEFSSENLRIGIAVKSSLKKSFHRLNFLKVENPKRKDNLEFRGVGNRIQTPFEVVSGLNIKRDFVKYRIFISSIKGIEKPFNEIKNHLLEGRQIYNLTLGTANFSASISNVTLFQRNEITLTKANGETIEMNSAVIVTEDKQLDFDLLGVDTIYIEESLMPADFMENNNRELSKMNRVLFTTSNIPLKLKLTGQYFQLCKDDVIQNIQFLE